MTENTVPEDPGCMIIVEHRMENFMQIFDEPDYKNEVYDFCKGHGITFRFKKKGSHEQPHSSLIAITKDGIMSGIAIGDDKDHLKYIQLLSEHMQYVCNETGIRLIGKPKIIV